MPIDKSGSQGHQAVVCLNTTRLDLLLEAQEKLQYGSTKPTL